MYDSYIVTVVSLLLLLILLLLLKEVSSARLRESDIHPISPKTPALQYQPIDRKKRNEKIVEDYSRNRAAQANKKALALLLKPASPTSSNTGSARAFQIDTESGTKVLLYCEVLQRGGAQVYRCATRTPRVMSASLSGCIGLHPILYSIQRTAADRR